MVRNPAPASAAAFPTQTLTKPSKMSARLARLFGGKNLFPSTFRLVAEFSFLLLWGQKESLLHLILVPQNKLSKVEWEKSLKNIPHADSVELSPMARRALQGGREVGSFDRKSFL